LAGLQNLLGPLLDLLQGLGAVSEAELQVAQVQHRAVFQVLVEIGAVTLQAVGLPADGVGAEAGGGPVGRDGIKGRAEEHGGGIMGVFVTLQEGIDIFTPHLSTTPPHRQGYKTRPCAGSSYSICSAVLSGSSGCRPDPGGDDTFCWQSR